MCGIAGVIYADASRPIESQILQNMGDSIAHRGPDGEGYWIEPGIGLVHRRLAIIDLDNGVQPIGNEDGSVQVVFNGEIYNYQELRADLVAKGHRFRTRTDTETLVHLYEESGTEMVNRLRGMFAFAIWDRRRRQLFLARDRVGIKPLYIYHDEEKFLFGSEPKAILAHPALRTEIDPVALEDYFTFGFVPGPRSIFKGIEKLQPAHVLVIRPGELDLSPRRYWRLKFRVDGRLTGEEWQEAIRAKVDETVRSHLIADVPVGALLSGGVDSGVIIASTSGVSAEQLHTFSIGFKEEAFCELPQARAVAEQYGTAHVEEIVTPDAASLLDEITAYYDEPFADPSAIPTYLVTRLAARTVKVALSGDGGDEAFGGYSRYAHDLRESRIRQALPPWFRRLALAPLAKLWPKADWLPRPLRMKTALTNISRGAGDAYANTLSLCREPLRRRLIASEVRAQLHGHSPASLVKALHEYAIADDPLCRMIAVDTGLLLPDDFLVKVDRASMAHGLEVRTPFLDHELLELAARIPSRWKVGRGNTKWIFKETFRRQLPNGAVDRPKHGFEMPIGEWLRGPLGDMFQGYVLDRRALIGSYVDQGAAEQLYRSHVRGVGNHGNALWALLVLARWCERFARVGGNCDVFRPIGPRLSDVASSTRNMSGGVGTLN